MQKRQEKIVSFVELFYLSHKYPPSIRDIQSALGIKSTSTVHRDVLTLSEQNKLDIVNTHILPVFTEEYIQRLIRSF